MHKQWRKNKNDEQYIKDLESIILSNKVKWFERELRLRGLFATKWLLGYKEFLTLKFGDNDLEFKEDILLKNDFDKEMVELVNFLVWFDENVAENNSERYIKLYEEDF